MPGFRLFCAAIVAPPQQLSCPSTEEAIARALISYEVKPMIQDAVEYVKEHPVVTVVAVVLFVVFVASFV